MEDDIVEFEGQVEELFDSANLLSYVCVHLALIRLLLAPVEDEAVVELLVFGLTKLLFYLVFVGLALVEYLVLA